MTPKRAALIAWATRAANELADILDMHEDERGAPTKRRPGRRVTPRPVVSETQKAEGRRLARLMGLEVIDGDDDTQKTG